MELAWRRLCLKKKQYGLFRCGDAFHAADAAYAGSGFLHWETLLYSGERHAHDEQPSSSTSILREYPFLSKLRAHLTDWYQTACPA
jgi:hypothetical protein